MAARQDQTQQIALIVFAILLVLFLGLTYWFYKQSSDAFQQLSAMESEKNEAQTQFRRFQANNDQVLQLMGFEQQADWDKVQEQVKDDMDRMGATLPEAKRNYREVLQVIYEENQQIAAAQAVDKEKIKSLEQTLAGIEAGHQAQITRLEADKAKVEQEAAANRNQFTAARAALDKSQKELADQIAKQTADFEKARAELVALKDAAEEEAADRQKTIDKYLAERAQEEFSFEVADGRVTYVNQANNIAWINLGSSDSLRRQVTFSVYDTEETDAGKAEKKGAIEVVRMLSEHMAECRVTDDNPRNPILPNDYIYSPVWHAGRPQHFALTGFIDLNGDGRSDLQLAKDLIELNGGIVDASPNPETNEQEGELTIDTRYMVFGERSEKVNDGAIRKTWEDMHDRANALGVELISVIDFANQMGYKPEDKTVGLGASAQSSDFRPRPSPAKSGLRPRSTYYRTP